ncbi:protein kinase [Paenibacillus taichungensis]|uniref:serine/threonine protein kinase n=1 Tax=Paenibacillus taichungensis TaxID=484184 RepID=UPI002DBEFAED|nr:protein kinase [Paenibacillus taichungensis]MEC0105682.1 protein kinase [Paenibacillus taichungensis]MEC0198235.1 protein kinase [Paenibacillus taichungensis]
MAGVGGSVELRRSWQRLLGLWTDRPRRKGTKIAGRYTIYDLLGMGSYGLTYLCTDEQTGKDVALKESKPSKGRLAVQLLDREADVVNRMDHPAIPKLLDVFTYRARSYIVTEYILGETLEQCIFEQGCKYTEQDCLELVKQLLAPIMHVHEQGYIHGDVRIPNVILRDVQVHLIDFGLARRMGEPLLPELKRRMHELPEPEDELAAPDQDLQDLGHFLLFMLYSAYEPEKGRKPASWQEELKLTPEVRDMLERLLGLRPGYEGGALELQADIDRVLMKLR